jgi:trk system potassium uptake protein TrkH
MLSPARILVGGFTLVSILGALLLMLPMATVDQQGLAFIDAWFMATSAVCVTGLAVITPRTDLTMFGQLVILFLIQIGGIGFMTIASMMAVLLGKRISIRDRLLLKEALNQQSLDGIVLVIAIVVATVAIELVGAIVLTAQFWGQMPPAQAVYYGIFHAISAFNNAGFDLFGNSLVDFSQQYVIQTTIAGLIIVGGLGYIVMLNVVQTRFRFAKMTVHSKIVLMTSAVLLVVATLVFWALEWRNTIFQHQSIDYIVMNSFFQSVSLRTAGFNTVDLMQLRDATVYFMIFVMFIGASPGSTGGGIKTTTLAVAVLLVYHVIRGRKEVTVFYRTITQDFVIKSFVLIMLSVFMVMLTTFVLTMSESRAFLPLLFESVSAFATVGLSLGVTPELTPFGKVMIIVTMLAGRVGPLTLFFAMSNQAATTGYRYPEDKIIIG